jgi:hypothetical protein
MKVWLKGGIIGLGIALILSISGILMPLLAIFPAMLFRLLFCNSINCSEMSFRNLFALASVFNIIVFSLIGILIGWLVGRKSSR